MWKLFSALSKNWMEPLLLKYEANLKFSKKIKIPILGWVFKVASELYFAT